MELFTILSTIRIIIHEWVSGKPYNAHKSLANDVYFTHVQCPPVWGDHLSVVAPHRYHSTTIVPVSVGFTPKFAIFNIMFGTDTWYNDTSLVMKLTEQCVLQLPTTLSPNHAVSSPLLEPAQHQLEPICIHTVSWSTTIVILNHHIEINIYCCYQDGTKITTIPLYRHAVINLYTKVHNWDAKYGHGIMHNYK